jgi:LemA protein
MVLGYKTKPNFTVENEKEISRPPSVDFAPASSKSPGEAQGAAR